MLPCSNFNASSRYKGHVNARVGGKSNTYREYHEDAHYLFARNKYRRELASLFPEEIGILSIDNMSKIKVGAPAVSRYHQIKTFLPVNDQPNLSEYDFPVPGYLLGTSRYMFLEPKTNVIPEDTLSSIYNKECAGILVNESKSSKTCKSQELKDHSVMCWLINLRFILTLAPLAKRS